MFTSGPYPIPPGGIKTANGNTLTTMPPDRGIHGQNNCFYISSNPGRQTTCPGHLNPFEPFCTNGLVIERHLEAYNLFIQAWQRRGLDVNKDFLTIRDLCRRGVCKWDDDFSAIRDMLGNSKSDDLYRASLCGYFGPERMGQRPDEIMTGGQSNAGGVAQQGPTQSQGFSGTGGQQPQTFGYAPGGPLQNQNGPQVNYQQAPQGYGNSTQPQQYQGGPPATQGYQQAGGPPSAYQTQQGPQQGQWNAQQPPRNPQFPPQQAGGGYGQAHYETQGAQSQPYQQQQSGGGYGQASYGTQGGQPQPYQQQQSGMAPAPPGPEPFTVQFTFGPANGQGQGGQGGYQQ
ncbi:hypothetical protein K402DRAFT_388746 [Aulographum hederae CBS 113979]|uniref:Uncharacterized protein n=1 Tax=Aulographum hederae CBS 113979 TaxID=1176131 RepID=A0A6G1HDT6_9PEZI|nr:hypothetical protein K402DRAFT_388746 [Aulographum hederae CBS 113979]